MRCQVCQGHHDTTACPALVDLIPGMAAPKPASIGPVVVNIPQTIKSQKCIAPPFGCGLPIVGFRDGESEREYQVSGMCQSCQDKQYGPA